MAQLPSSLLSNEPLMDKLAIFSLPIVRVVDYFAGATNAMRIDVSCEKDPTVKEMALYGKLQKNNSFFKVFLLFKIDYIEYTKSI